MTTLPQTPLTAATNYLQRGWAPIPVPHQRKAPVISEWQHLRLTEADLDAHFGRRPSNIGVLLGKPSGGLIDVDLDSEEARRLADRLLPVTGAIFGRSSAPRSHRLYVVRDSIKTTKFQDPTRSTGDHRTMLVEVRSTGTQTLAPPSFHPTGEIIEWQCDGEPASVSASGLVSAAGELAAAVLLARHWPLGTRHDAALALAGGFAHAGWKQDRITTFVLAVAEAAGDEEIADRERAVHSTCDAHAAGQSTTGWPRLADLVGAPVVDRVRAWLGIRRNVSQPPLADDADGADDPSSPFDTQHDEPGQGGRPSQATLLVGLVEEQGVELFHDADGDAYAALEVDGHQETWRLSSTTFEQRVSLLYYRERGRVPGRQTIQDALAVLGGRARFDGPLLPVAVRIAMTTEAVWLDLGDPEWRVVRVDLTGWRVLPARDTPVRFIRPRGMLALPLPQRGGTLAPLVDLFALNDDTLVLVAGWLLGTLYPAGGRAGLAIYGEQGSGKTALARFLRSLVDPTDVPLRSPPKDETDLLIAAQNGAIVALDNLSTVPRWLSDALCRLATGGGISKRKLYSDGDEVVLDAQRPVLLTAITPVVDEPDLLDRMTTVELPVLETARRRTELDLERRIVAARPQLLGVLLDGVATGLRRSHQVESTNLPRLADFGRFVDAASPAFGWDAGLFLDVYGANQRTADGLAVEAHPVGPAIVALMSEREQWEGSPTQLLEELGKQVPEETRKDRSWPKQPNRLSHQLKRLQPNLRRLGIGVGGDRVGHTGQRVVVLTRYGPVWDRQHRQRADSAHSDGTNADDPHRQHSPEDRQRPAADRQHDTSQSPDDWDGSRASGDGADDADDPTPTATPWVDSFDADDLDDVWEESL